MQKDKIVILYVENFVWNHLGMAKDFKGHPKVGRVYRALKNEETGIYRLKIDEKLEDDIHGLMLEELEGDFARWSCKFKALENKDDLADYDIEPEDFRNIQAWMDTNNADLEELRSSAPIEEYTIEMREVVPESANDSIKEIAKYDPMLAESAVWVLELIAASMASDRTQTTTELSNTLSELGKGANMALSLDRLEKYINASEDFPPYLFQSIYYILLEIARVNSNQINKNDR